MNLASLSLEKARIVDVSLVCSGEYTSPEGFYLDHLAPMTIVRLDLFPSERSRIRVEVVLPERWNGRLLGKGNGGAAGRLGSEAHFAGEHSFATVHSDLGTFPAPFEAGCGNPEIWKDFGWRATHLMTLAAKEIIRAKYGKFPDFSYFHGGSTGGQQAFSEAQRFPEDYDGIFAEVPAHCRCPLHAYFLWCYQHSRAEDGITPLFTPKQKERWKHTVLDHFAARENFPRAKHRFISEPRWSKEDQQEVLRLSAQRDPSLTPKHLAALQAMMDGPRNCRTRERIFNGIPPGIIPDESVYGNLYLFRWFFGQDTDFRKIDFDASIDRFLTEMGKELNAEDPDLTLFEKRGGKIIATSGTADPVVPYHATLDYYERVIEHFGSLEKVRDFFRYYLLPGRDHGAGDGIQELNDPLDALIAWREKGIVPQMTGVHYGENGGKTPLEAYPDGRIRGAVERIAPRYLV